MSAEVQYEATDSGFRLTVVDGGEPVARLAVGRYAMRIGSATVQMGGIADVVAHPAHRGKGHGALQLRAAVEHLRRERYAVSVLFGIPDFYHRFGFAPVLPEYTVAVATRDAERLGTGAAELRAARPEDAAALLDLYARVNANRTGTLQRTAATYDLSPRPEGENWWTHPRRGLVADLNGRPAGYALLAGNPSHLRVQEVVVAPEHVATAGTSLIAALAREGLNRRLEQFRLSLPPDEPLVDLLRQVGCKVEITYPASGGGMGRITHLPALVEALAPVLKERAAALQTGARPGLLDLVCSAAPDERSGTGGGEQSGRGDQASGQVGERVTMPLGSGPAVTLTLPQHRLCQLVLGYRSLDAIRLQHPDACSTADLPALRALFPPGYPHMWSIDHF